MNQHSFSYSRVIILVTTLRTTSGRGPKPCMDLDFTHAIKTSGTMQKITHVCAVVTGQYRTLIGTLKPLSRQSFEIENQPLARSKSSARLKVTL